MSFPCGKCPKCVKRRQSGWSFRLQQQFKVATHAQFITLTYDTSTVPVTERGYMVLCKRDLQLFFKRLRKAANKESCGQQIKYYAVESMVVEDFDPITILFCSTAQLN